MKRDGVEWLACMVLASIGLVYCLWVVPYIPTHDGPQHIFSAHVENHYSEPGSRYPDFYQVLPQFAAKGFAIVYGPLENALPWRVALRVTFSLMTLAFAWGFALVVLAVDRTRRPTAMLGFVIALPWSLYMGSFAFVIGTTLGMYTVASVIHRPPATGGRRAVLALLLLLQGVAHLFSAMLTGVIVLVLATVAAPKGTRLREIGRMAMVGAPVLALLAFTLRERNLRASEQQVFQWSVTERLGEISRWFVPGPGVRGWLVIGVLCAAIGTTLAHARRGRASPTEQALAWLALAFLVLTLVAPLHMPGWQFLAPRFALDAMVLGLAVARPPQGISPRTTRALVPLVTVLCLCSSLVSAGLHRRLANGCADALAGLDAPLRLTGPRLPFVLHHHCGVPLDPAESEVPGAAMAENTPLLYLIDHGGIGTRVFNGTPSIFAIGFIASSFPPPPAPRALAIAQSEWFGRDPNLTASVLTELAADGMPFDGIHFLGGRPSDFAVFNERGYVTEFQGDSLFIARFEGCPAELLLPPEALGADPVSYEYGLFSRTNLAPEPRTFGIGLVRHDTPVVGGVVHVPLRGRPCGEIWVRVVWDADRSSTFTPGDRTCENADTQGRLRAHVSRDHPTVRCVPSP